MACDCLDTRVAGRPNLLLFAGLATRDLIGAADGLLITDTSLAAVGFVSDDLSTESQELVQLARLDTGSVTIPEGYREATMMMKTTATNNLVVLSIAK